MNVVYAKPHGNHKAKSCNRYTKIKRKEAKYSTRENHQIIKGKRRKEQRIEGRDQKSYSERKIKLSKIRPQSQREVPLSPFRRFYFI